MEQNEDKKRLMSEETLKALIDLVITRQNEQAQIAAHLRTRIEALEARMDEATHMTSDEYGQQVVEQIMASLPAIQAAAMKKAKARPVIGGSRQ